MLRSLMLLSLLLVSAVQAHAVEIEKLPGYSKFTVSDDFIAHLKKNTSLAATLEKDADLSRLVLTRAVLQTQLMKNEITLAEIKKSYFPNHANKEERSTQQAYISDEARNMTKRAIANAQNPSARRRAQKDVADAVGNAPAEQADAAADADDVVEDTTPAPTPTNSFVNLSAVPSNEGVDANGWPVALNVPADCPARVENTDYIFNLKRRRAAQHNPTGEEQDRIHGFFGVGNGQVVLYDGQEQVAPFVTVNAEGPGPRITNGPSAYSGVYSTAFVDAYAYCPGDFSGITPAGEVALSKGCIFNRRAKAATQVSMVSYVDSPLRAVQPDVCHLEPNKRYFVNTRLDPAAGYVPGHCAYMAKQVEPWKKYLKTVNGKEVGICAYLTTGDVHQNHGRGVPAPYTGSCLNAATGLIGDGLYPLNYTDLLCHGAQCTADSTPAYHYTCYDPTGKNPPREYVNECISGERLWTKGHMTETPSDYLCENKRVSADGSSCYGNCNAGQGQQGYAASAVCAAHNEGRVRQRSCTRDGVGYADGVTEEQCQFVTARGRYDWIEISTSGDRQHVNNQGDRCHYTFVENPQLPDGCRAAGKVHPVGTKKTIGCWVGIAGHESKETKHVSECRVLGEGFAPAFVAVSGVLGTSRCEPAVYE